MGVAIGQGLLAVLFLIVQLGNSAHAEGSRSLFPQGYFSGEPGNANPSATRTSLSYGTDVYLGKIRQANFFYVYARSNEYILVGTSGARSAVRLFAPPGPGQTLQQRFGVPGLENPATIGSTLSLSNCAAGSGNISSRTLELRGPQSANGAGNGTGFAPCYYQVPNGEDGIYGVALASGSATVQMWDITVRADAASATDIDGRVFTYALSGDSGAATNPTYATHYYISNDGYRYSQTMRGLAPYRYVLYSNPQGFLDVNGNPLYKDVRGQTNIISTIRPAGTGIDPQGPTYPMFFSDVHAPSVDTADGLHATLGALGIPVIPDDPQVLSASFTYSYTGGASTYVGQGGNFTLSTQDALTYQIVIKGGNTPAHDDPGHPDNRVLTGIATGLNQQIVWDGMTNSGTPMPPGSGYRFEVTGRAGEVHFPFLDAEGNLNGGPTVTRLNGSGSPDATVYYDDRGYTTNGVDVGTPAGHICGPSAGGAPTPDYSLLGVDSSNPNLNGSGHYYRYWGAAPYTGNPNADCSINGYFGDAKGMDLWTFIKGNPPPGALELTILSSADVAATVSIPASVAPGATGLVVASFGNVGSLTAADTAYAIQLPANLSGVSCTGATCSYNAATGLVTISGLPSSLSPRQWTNNVTLQYTAPTNGTVSATATVTTSSPQPAAPALSAPDSDSGAATVAVGGTTADVLALVTSPAAVAPGDNVSATVTFRNLGPLAATGVTYSMTLPVGLSGISCAAPANCVYNSTTGAITVTGLANSLSAGASVPVTLSYTAPGSGLIQLTATVNTATSESDSINNTASGATIVSATADADVTASVAPPSSVIGGSTVNVPVTFRNLGPAAAAGVDYAMTLPAGLSGVSCSAPVTCSYNSATGALTPTAGVPVSLASGTEVAFVVSYTAPAIGTAGFNAVVSTSTTESNTTNNSATAQTTIIPNTYTVSFDTNGGSAVASINNVTHGTTISAPTAPTRVGYTFTGWYEDAGLSDAWVFATDTVMGPTTLHAGWVLNQYTVTYNAGANGSITGVASQIVTHGGTSTAVTATPDAGYHFVSWSDGITTSTRTDTNVTSNRSVTATFAINQYTLTYNAGANGSITGTTPQTVNHGSNGTAVTATPGAGYHFVSWSDGITTSTRTDTNVTSNRSVTATFAINQYTLTYAAGANGSISGTTPQTVNHGANGSAVTAVPAAGYRFVAWSDGLPTATRTDTNVTSNRSITATFAINQHTLTYIAGANGTISGAALQAVALGANGSAVTAVPAPGYRFVSWSDGVTSATRTDLDVQSDLTVTANFTLGSVATQEHTVEQGSERTFEPPPGATLSNFRRIRGGRQTAVDDPTPADYADVLECTGTTCRFLGNHSGRYELTYTDTNGATTIYAFIVYPNVGYAIERQTGRPGTQVTVRVVLDDLPIAEEVRIAYSIQNAAAIGSPLPTDLLTRNPQALVFNVGPNGNVTCFEAGQCEQEIIFTPTVSNSDVQFQLHDSEGVVIGNYRTHTVSLVPVTMVPVTAELVVVPGHTVTAGSPVTAGVIGLPPGNYSFDWSSSESALGIGTQTTDATTPVSTTAGNYAIHVTVRDLDNPNRPAITLNTWLRVVTAAQSSSVCGSQGCDDDGTRIPVAQQASQCALGVNDPANSTPYRLQVGAKNWTWDSAGLCLETAPGYGMRLGEVSFLSSPSYGAGVEASAIRDYGSDGGEARNATDYTHTHSGLNYDFEVTGLVNAGASAPVVVPLPRNLTMPADAVWRKFDAADGWATFVVDATNTMHSAASIGGQCPSPVSPLWDANPGLVAGLDCVRLVIQDGGPNDADRQTNGVIANTGALGVQAGGQKITSSDKKGGGGAMNPLWLLLLGVLALCPGRRSRASIALLAIGASAQGADTQADVDGIRSSGWFLGATGALAMGEVGSEEVTRGLNDLGIGLTARVEDEDRFAWRGVGGYRFGKYLSLEAGYTNLGVVTTYINGTPLDLYDIPHVLPASGAGPELSVSGYLPIAERLDLYARLGVWHWETLYHLHETDQKRRPKSSDTDVLGGIGARYWLSPRWQAGVSYERYRIDEQDVDLLGLNIVYQFGSKDGQTRERAQPIATTAVAAPVAAPAPIAVPAPVARSVAPPPAPPPPPAISVFLVNFGFDSSVLIAQSKSIIAEAAEYLVSHRDQKVLVTGHTDLHGSVRYNLNLSMRRAQAVADELVARGVALERIQVSARGLSEPLSDESNEESQAADRRVHIIPVQN